MNLFSDIREVVEGAKSELFDLAKKIGGLNKDVKELDKPLAKEVNFEAVKPALPYSNGKWDGEIGNSTWHPDENYIPPEKNVSNPYSNPDNLSWKQLNEKYGIDGIEFKDGYPVFDEVSKGSVDIQDFETGGQLAKNHNFKKADINLAQEKGCTPQEVAQWRKDNNYTWHECENQSTMQKVPNEIHANVFHYGGRSLGKLED